MVVWQGPQAITAEYEPQTPAKSAQIWIQDGEETQESTVLIIIGGVLTGIPIVFGVLSY